MRDISKVKTAAERERMNIPMCNRDKFDIELVSYLEEMALAGDERFAELAMKLWQRHQLMQRMDVSAAPPLLCKKINEGSEDYLNRCYQAGGYCNAW
jgi:hypothetical protein